MFTRLRKCFLGLFTIVILFSVGCDSLIDTPEEVSEEVNIIVQEEALANKEEKEISDEMEQIISAEDFMEFYNISETDVPRDYVQSYIWEYGLPQKIKQDDVEKKWGEKVILAYKTGKPMGEYLGSLFHGPESNLELEEYLENADIILFDFNMRFGKERYSTNKMTIDLKNKIIYFTQNNTDKYTESELKAELSDDDVQKIREELPKHIVEGNGVGTYGVSSEYSFVINMKADDYSTKSFSGDYGDETHFPGFDEYWKTLYKDYFGVEYFFNDNN